MLAKEMDNKHTHIWSLMRRWVDWMCSWGSTLGFWSGFFCCLFGVGFWFGFFFYFFFTRFLHADCLYVFAVSRLACLRECEQTLLLAASSNMQMTGRKPTQCLSRSLKSLRRRKLSKRTAKLIIVLLSMYQESKAQLHYASNIMIPRRELCKNCYLLLLISSFCVDAPGQFMWWCSSRSRACLLLTNECHLLNLSLSHICLLKPFFFFNVIYNLDYSNQN